MTFVGLITLAGILVTFAHTIRPSVHSDVHKAWWCLFVQFCVATICVRLDLDHSTTTLYYVIAALINLVIIFAIFISRMTLASFAIALIFIVNVAGLTFGLEQYQLIGVDILDVGVWVQLALLFQLSRDYPDDTITRPSATTDDAQSNVSRVVHDDNYGTRRAHSAG